MTESPMAVILSPGGVSCGPEVGAITLVFSAAGMAVISWCFGSCSSAMAVSCCSRLVFVGDVATAIVVETMIPATASATMPRPHHAVPPQMLPSTAR